MTHVNIPALAHNAHPVVQIFDGQAITTSIEVARVFGKRHAHVLDAIKTLMQQLPKNDQPNFRLVDYTDEKGERRPAYYLTRDGFTLLTMGFTGKKALAFKLAYIQAFNGMEARLVEPASASTPTTTSYSCRAEQAYALAMQTASQIADKVFKAALLGNPATDRWVVIISGNGTKATVVDPRAVILTPEEIAEGIRNGDVGVHFNQYELMQLGQAALERLKRHFDKTVSGSTWVSVNR